MSIEVMRNCAAIECFSLAVPGGFLCAHHCALLPASNQDELRSTFDAWKHKTDSRMKYLAARLRAIVAIATLEQRKPSAIVLQVLEMLDETNALEMEA